MGSNSEGQQDFQRHMIHYHLLKPHRYFLKYNLMILICLPDLILEIHSVKLTPAPNFESQSKVIISHSSPKNPEKLTSVALFMTIERHQSLK